MADWRKLAMAAILADGKIDAAEVKILKKELLADKKIDKAEATFLVELRNTAQKKARGDLNAAFEKFFFDALATYILADGQIDTAEAKWLEGVLLADKKVDANEKKFLARLKKAAKKTSPAFDALYEKCMAK